MRRNAKRKGPRPAETYRGARRNAALRGEVKGVWRGIQPTRRRRHPAVRLNRSTQWPEAPTYAAARKQATERPYKGWRA